jgi:hypothetical protein
MRRRVYGVRAPSKCVRLGCVRASDAVCTVRRPRPRHDVLYTENAKSFDEAADRTGWFADGPGEEAMFRCPMGCVQTEDGTTYVTDWGNHCIRRRTPDGVWSTLAGNTFSKSST